MQKTNDFLTALIEPNRAKILRLLVLYDTEEHTLASIAERAGVAPALVAREAAALTALGVLREAKGQGKNEKERKAATRYSFNSKFKHAQSLAALVRETSDDRFDDVDRALRHAGRFSAIVLSGIFLGDLQRPADLIIVGDAVNEKRLEKAVRSFEPKYGREIRYAVFSTPEFRYRLTIHDKLVRDTLDYPHRILLNKHDLI